MDGEAGLSAIAGLIADEHRAQLLLTLLAGAPLTGSALADSAGISRSLASAHLRKLVAGGLVQVQPQGRQRLYSIASAFVADALEALLLLAPPAQVSSLRQDARSRSLQFARLCYDHLAGLVGVAVTRSLIEQGLIGEQAGSFLVTGADGFRDFGIDVAALTSPGRALARPCLDWTEHRYHLGGSLGAALTTGLLHRRWLRRQPGSRAVTVTAAGRSGLAGWLGIDVAGLRAGR